MPAQGSGRPLTDRLFGWGRRAEKEAPDATESAASSERTVPTKAFSRFLYALSLRESPIVLDLGPIVGGNVNFLGERLGCKYLVEDLYQNIEAHVTSKTPPDLAAFFEKRFPQADASIDGVLCWDVLDYLDKASAQIVAREMMRILKPGGAVFGFFSNVASTEKEYTRYLIVDDKTLKYRAAHGLAGAPAGLRQPRHHPAVRRPDGVRLVPAPDQDARDGLPQARTEGRRRAGCRRRRRRAAPSRPSSLDA